MNAQETADYQRLGAIGYRMAMVRRGDMLRLISWHIKPEEQYRWNPYALVPKGSLGVVKEVTEQGLIVCMWETGYGMDLRLEDRYEKV